MIKNLIKIIFLLFAFLLTSLDASSIDISQNAKIPILKNSHIYLDDKNLKIEDMIEQNLFKTYSKNYINIGVTSKILWIKFTLQNSSKTPVEKLLILTSPVLEHVVLYANDDFENPVLKGNFYKKDDDATLFPFYRIALEPESSKTYYIKTQTIYNHVDFSLVIQDEKIHRAEDKLQQFKIVFFIGMIVALILYSIMLYSYTKYRAFLYYSFYLIAFIFFQANYLGLSQLYLPLNIAIFDSKMLIFKLSILIITFALFAMHFLKLKSSSIIYKVYKIIIIIAILEIFLSIIFQNYDLNISIITGTLFIMFNVFAGFYIWLKGNKEAKFFVIGYSIATIAYTFVIVDALGFSSIMQLYPNLLIVGTVIEALILLLAFADQHSILQKEKEKSDQRILDEYKERKNTIQVEVKKKTKELNSTLKAKELLLQEVHHRVKNNLQTILSIVRLQNDEIKDNKIVEKFINLENRINAIAKTYDMLIIKDDLEKINMNDYIKSLLLDINEAMGKSATIDIKTDIDATIPLKESIYIGLIINELVTNAYKYAFDNKKGTINITLKQKERSCVLIIEDDGKGFKLDDKQKTLGLQLVETLVLDQLLGSIDMFVKNQAKFIIRFSV